MSSVEKLGSICYTKKPSSTMFVGESATISGSCSNAHHISIGINGVDWRHSTGENFNTTICFETPGNYSIRVCARNTESATDEGSEYCEDTFTINVIDIPTLGELELNVHTAIMANKGDVLKIIASCNNAHHIAIGINEKNWITYPGSECERDITLEEENYEIRVCARNTELATDYGSYDKQKTINVTVKEEGDTQPLPPEEEVPEQPQEPSNNSKTLYIPGSHNKFYDKYSVLFNKYCCSACALANVAEYYSESAHDNDTLERKLIEWEVLKNDNKDIMSEDVDLYLVDYNAKWSKCPSGVISTTTFNESNINNLLPIIKKEIDADRPIIIVETGEYGTHYVVAFKYVNNASTNEDIYVLDSTNIWEGVILDDGKTYKRPDPEIIGNMIRSSTCPTGKIFTLKDSGIKNKCENYRGFKFTAQNKSELDIIEKAYNDDKNTDIINPDHPGLGDITLPTNPIPPIKEEIM
ncbi:hypothetical protein JYG23_00085 [Sedimentibacter sp. zth1]|uniref:hypothetical protein n=1 Tax=Sedimentibacter sp. zth1 TaxID=2816908 RepID=UPI001A925DF8|nr:hypothetical protein [Sedimentibacter sp. zth1]QSX05907.1 hypothetical protein JYG23_00085 [Sedimentibacter sp. zth1]